MQRNEKAPQVTLDRQRLLGFDQSLQGRIRADASRLADPRMAKLGTKNGAATGLKGGPIRPRG